MKTKTNTKKTKITELIDRLHNEVEQFYNSDKWANYLQFMSKFINRSHFNQFLIQIFGGTDTLMVMGYQQFIERLNRIPVACKVCRAIATKNCSCEERTPPVRIPQLAPMTYNKKTEDENGEEVEEKKLFFREVFVFKFEDTEQLEGKPVIPVETSVVEKIDIEVEDYDLMEAKLIQIVEDNNFQFKYENIHEEALNGWCDFTNKELVIDKNMPNAQTIKTIIHEIGHMFAHEEFSQKLPRALKETEAESIAYVVSHHLGIDTSSYSIGYVTGWSDNEEFILLESVGRVSKTSKKILELLEI
tara:strand:- start:2184 stop:3089 length:906 start_codon:yes stop_codon:yes gene_type:complete